MDAKQIEQAGSVVDRMCRVGAFALVVGALAGCGGGGSDSGSDKSFFGITGSRAGDTAYTVCVEGSGFIDPNTTAGQKMAQTLAEHYQYFGSGMSYSGSGKTCREYYGNPNVVISMADYSLIALSAVALPTPSPAASSPNDFLLPVTPRTCGASEGAGFNGLELVGPARQEGLSTMPKVIDPFSFDPGLVRYVNSTLSSTALTGSLRVTLWAASGAYTGAAMPAVSIYRAPLDTGSSENQLRNGFQVDPPLASVSGTTPTVGSYCLVVTLEQYAETCTAADKYCIVDWYQFPTAVQFQ